MAEAIQDTSGLPGTQYIPSNGCEGDIFIDSWCARCTRDRAMREGISELDCNDDELCPIIRRSYIGQAVEWRRDDEGKTFCVSFVDASSRR